MSPCQTISVVLSFDVEEHYRIEAAAGLNFSHEQKSEYATRMEFVTRQILDQLSEAQTTATFFIVGEIAKSHPKLVREVVERGNEVASHGWDHRTVHRFDAITFREDLRISKDALEQVTSQAVVGYRAPTFSIGPKTAWAIDALVSCGYRYDSSVFPVRHDRYGVPKAPRTPFVIQGDSAEILELPPATWRLLGQNLPVAGGGYFRLFPLSFMLAGLKQLARTTPPVGMLYFHPWEFDVDQPRLPLRKLARWRTYVGVGRSRSRLDRLLRQRAGCFTRAIDVVKELEKQLDVLPRYRLNATDPAAQLTGSA